MVLPDNVHAWWVLLSMCTKTFSLDDLIFDCISFVIQKLNGQEEHQVSGRRMAADTMCVVLVLLTHVCRHMLTHAWT